MMFSVGTTGISFTKKTGDEGDGKIPDIEFHQ